MIPEKCFPVGLVYHKSVRASVGIDPKGGFWLKIVVFGSMHAGAVLFVKAEYHELCAATLAFYAGVCCKSGRKAYEDRLLNVFLREAVESLAYAYGKVFTCGERFAFCKEFLGI